MVVAEAAGPARRVRVGCWRGQLARRGGSILLATAEGRERGEGVGGLEGGRLRLVVGEGRAPLGRCGLVVEERVDAAHGGAGDAVGGSQVVHRKSRMARGQQSMQRTTKAAVGVWKMEPFQSFSLARRALEGRAARGP